MQLFVWFDIVNLGIRLLYAPLLHYTYVYKKQFIIKMESFKQQTLCYSMLHVSIREGDTLSSCRNLYKLKVSTSLKMTFQNILILLEGNRIITAHKWQNSLHESAIKFVLKKQLVLKIPNILKKYNFVNMINLR